jgi:hypothetical protein
LWVTVVVEGLGIKSELGVRGDRGLFVQNLHGGGVTPAASTSTPMAATGQSRSEREQCESQGKVFHGGLSDPLSQPELEIDR